MRQAMTNTEDHACSQKPMQLASEDTSRSIANTGHHAWSQKPRQLASEDTARSASLTVL